MDLDVTPQVDGTRLVTHSRAQRVEKGWSVPCRSPWTGRSAARLSGMYRMVRWSVLVSLAWLATASIPSLARYLKMRSM